MKKVGIIAIVLVMLMGISAHASNEDIFTDVPSSAYYSEAIRWAISNGITEGMGNGKFGVGQTVTRAQAVTFLWRSCGQKDPTTKVNPFKDVKESDYYYKAVLWAVENGITNGTSADTFSPNDNVTRGQLITFLYRTRGGSTDSGAQWYTAAENWAKSKNLLTGTAQAYGTDKQCPREDVVYYLWREMQSGNSGGQSQSGGQSDTSSNNGEVEIDDGDGSEGHWEYQEGEEDIRFG